MTSGVDLLQVVSERVPMRKAGRSYLGHCPFHEEKTPSFHVDPELRTFRCFGCNESGGLDRWIELMHPVPSFTVITEGRVHFDDASTGIEGGAVMAWGRVVDHDADPLFRDAGEA